MKKHEIHLQQTAGAQMEDSEVGFIAHFLAPNGRKILNPNDRIKERRKARRALINFLRSVKSDALKITETLAGGEKRDITAEIMREVLK